MKKLTLIVLASGLSVSAASAQEFWNLGGDRLSTSISTDGVVVGDNLASGQYFMWTAGGGQMDFGGQIAGQGVGGQSTISHDGQTVGGTLFNPLSGVHEMGRYQVATNTWTPLGGLGTNIDGETSSGWAISGDGNTQVGLGWVPPANGHAIRWQAGTGIVDMGSTAVDRSSRANTTNFDGSVVAGWQDNDNGRQGAVWVNGTQELITDTNGFAASEALSISNDGTFVSGIQFGGFFAPSELWRYNTVTNSYEGLGNLTDGGAAGTTAGNAMNGDGTLIAGGTWGFGPAFFGTAIIWEEGVGVQRFSEYLDARGVIYEPGYSFAYVTDMSSDGLWFTGWGLTSDFQLTSFVVQVPTPGVAGLLAFAGLAATRRRRA
jgi:hypothetical protein